MAELMMHLLLTAIYSQTFRKRLQCVRLMLILELFLAQEPQFQPKAGFPRRGSIVSRHQLLR
jgi:hypothetical protein